MRVGILYDEPADTDAAPDQDVLVQRDAVARALDNLGHTPVSIGCTLDLASLHRQLEREPVDCIFNLVESLAGTDRLASLVPLLLDAMGIPYTGSTGTVMLQTTDKVSVKQRLRALGIPTPDWYVKGDTSSCVSPGRYIIKARCEHASVGIDDAAVVSATNAAALDAFIDARYRSNGFEVFAEAFVDGREFNIAVLVDEAGQPLVLPAAEIDFSAFPSNMPRIVGYNAKWLETSFEFNATPRRFDFPSRDDALVERLTALAIETWHAFSLHGYARVDFRVDSNGNPQVLEINTNPCLSPDAGFAAALCESGITFETAIESILADALRVHGR